MLLPDIHEAPGSEFFVYQQDSALSHRAKTVETLALMDRETPNFIPPALWPPNSPDLNPVECASRASLSYQDLGRQRTETTHQQRVHGPLWVTQLLNVLLASGVSVYELAFVLEADILSTCCSLIFKVIKMMWCDTCDFLWDNNCQSCLSLFELIIQMYT